MSRPRPLIAIVAVVTALVFAGTAPATAHDQLLSSNPADGEVLATAPDTITMRFSDDVLDIGGVVVVADAEGTDWADGPLTLSGGDVTQAVKPGAPDGAYQIRWRVVSADGHPISDVIDYTVGDTAQPAITTGDAGNGSASATATPNAADPEAGASAPDLTGVVIAGWATGGAALGIGLYALILVLTRHRRRPTP